MVEARDDNSQDILPGIDINIQGLIPELDIKPESISKGEICSNIFKFFKCGFSIYFCNINNLEEGPDKYVNEDDDDDDDEYNDEDDAIFEYKSEHIHSPSKWLGS